MGAGRLAYRVAHGTECNWRKLICSSVRLESVRDEHAKPVANCCLSVKIFFPSCRDIGEMQ